MEKPRDEPPAPETVVEIDASPRLGRPELLCYREYENPPDIIPGRSDRDWMDATHQRFAYRCTPLAVANASGWELVLPFSYSATWNGGPQVGDV